MKITFLNGTDHQQATVRWVAHNLLNLPSDHVPLDWTVEFISDPDPSQHNEFAITEWTYDTITPHTKIGSVAPKWGKPFDGQKFFNEVVAHELGHGLFAALPHEFRVRIAELFGANSDSIGELNPEGQPWEKRIMEGIAETFKDAFLPRRHRRYYNRTKKHIPISKYPEFRRLFREAIPLIEVDEEGVPAYDFNIFRRGGYGMGVAHPDERGGLYTGKTGGGWNFESLSSMQVGGDPVQVQGKHKFKMAWTIPRSLLEQVIKDKFLSEVDLRITFEALVGKNIFARWSVFLSCSWVGEFEREGLEKHPEFQGITDTRPPGPEGGETEYLMWFGIVGTTTNGPQVNPPTITGGTGKEGLIPTLTIHSEFETDWPKEELQLLEILSTLKFAFAAKKAEEDEYIASLRETIPDFHFHQGGTTPEEGGLPIDVPTGDVQPLGWRAGAHPVKRLISGGRAS